MTFWFTSDQHFGHSNIIKYCDRPYKTVEDMDKALIRNWNARVGHEDTTFVLGDFCYKDEKKFKDYFYALNGNKIFIQGNHDHNNGVNTPILDMTINLGGKTILLIHNPDDISVFGGQLVLCGHVHNNWKFERRYWEPEKKESEYIDFCNVGVDVWKYMPVNINEILKDYNTWLDKNWKFEK